MLKVTTDKQTDRQTNKQTDKQTNRQVKTICTRPFDPGHRGHKNGYNINYLKRTSTSPPAISLCLSLSAISPSFALFSSSARRFEISRNVISSMEKSTSRALKMIQRSKPYDRGSCRYAENSFLHNMHDITQCHSATRTHLSFSPIPSCRGTLISFGKKGGGGKLSLCIFNFVLSLCTVWDI